MQGIDAAQAIANLVGLRPAVTLCVVYGGRIVHVPATPDPTHPIARDIGQTAFNRLANHYGGRSIALPQTLAPRLWHERRKVSRLAARGLNAAAIAEMLEISVASVQRYLSNAGGTPE